MKPQNHNARAGALAPVPYLLLGVAAVLLLVAGCATEVGNHTLIGKSYYPAKPKDAPIDVFTNELPSRPFDRVAILDVRCESQGFMTPNLEKDGLPVLKNHARAAGCDAIIEVAERTPQQNWSLETKVKQYTGVGIVYK